MDKSQPIWYETVMNLGFKEVEYEDEVYIKQYGIPYSVISLKLGQHVIIQFNRLKNSCELVRLDKNDGVIARENAISIETIHLLIKFFK